MNKLIIIFIISLIILGVLYKSVWCKRENFQSSTSQIEISNIMIKVVVVGKAWMVIQIKICMNKVMTLGTF